MVCRIATAPVGVLGINASKSSLGAVRTCMEIAVVAGETLLAGAVVVREEAVFDVADAGVASSFNAGAVFSTQRLRTRRGVFASIHFYFVLLTIHLLAARVMIHIPRITHTTCFTWIRMTIWTYCLTALITCILVLTWLLTALWHFEVDHGFFGSKNARSK